MSDSHFKQILEVYMQIADILGVASCTQYTYVIIIQHVLKTFRFTPKKKKLLDLHLKKKYIKQLFYFIVHIAFLQIIFLDFAAHILYQTGHLMFFGSHISFQG